MRASWMALVSSLALAGCLGSAPTDNGGGANNGGGQDPGGVTMGPGGVATGPDGAQVGNRQLRPLTPTEYDNTIRDVFALGASWTGAGLTPSQSSIYGFDNDATLAVMDDAHSQAIEAAAEKVADTVIASTLPTAVPSCASASRDCAAAVVDKYGPKLFHHALSDTERKRYLDAYDGLVGMSATPADALKWTLVALLDSPSFVYRFELGTSADGKTFSLSGEELATALAYTFTASPPTDDLLAQGRNGGLADPAARATVAKQLLDSPRGQLMVEGFMQRWLRYTDVGNLVKDATVDPDFASVRSDMAEETRRFLDHIFFEKKGTVTDLFTSNETYLTAALATHYGLPAPASAFALVQKPAEQALGILSQGSFLSRFALTHTSSPPQRGAFVRRKLLCQQLGNPPPNAGQPPLPQPGLTTRQLFEQIHSTQASCAGCHKQIDLIGFGLEGFDTAGRWRTMEANQMIKADGQILGSPTQGDVSFSDGHDLAAKLAASPDVGRCIGGLMSAYAFGTASGTTYAAKSQLDKMATSGVSLYEFFAQLAASSDFALRVDQ